ncbi:MAG: hypothetical protein HYY84_02360 [Deltaproteobacteria bacterium]|nr:hypothetical protein [Deltaproteobacteria bacterium]
MRIDLWNPAFLEAIRASGVSMHPIVALDGADVVSIAIGLGHNGLLFGRRVRIIHWSWFTTIRDRARQGVALKLARFGLGTSRDLGYDVNTGLIDAGSHAATMMQRHGTAGNGVTGPFFIARHHPMARVLGPSVVKDLRLPAFDRFILAATRSARTPTMPDRYSMRDCTALNDADERLGSRDADLRIIYGERDRVGCLASPPFFRTVEILCGVERVGIVQLLDLRMLGKKPIDCAAIERAWFLPGAFRNSMRALFAGLAAEGKGLVLASLFPRGARERSSLATLGMLPDLTRPMAICAWALSDNARDLDKVRTVYVPFR